MQSVHAHVWLPERGAVARAKQHCDEDDDLDDGMTNAQHLAAGQPDRCADGYSSSARQKFAGIGWIVAAAARVFARRRLWYIDTRVHRVRTRVPWYSEYSSTYWSIHNTRVLQYSVLEYVHMYVLASTVCALRVCRVSPKMEANFVHPWANNGAESVLRPYTWTFRRVGKK